MVKKIIENVISGFRRTVDENCALLCHYAASSGNSLPKVRYNLTVPSSKTLEAKRDRLSQNVGTFEDRTDRFREPSERNCLY